MKNLLTIPAVARCLGIPRVGVHDLIRLGHLPAVSLGPGVTRVHPDALDIMMSSVGGLPPVDIAVEPVVAHLEPALVPPPLDAKRPTEHATVTQILVSCAVPHVSKRELNAAARWLRGRGYKEVKRAGIRGFIVQWRPARPTAIQEAERLWGHGVKKD